MNWENVIKKINLKNLSYIGIILIICITRVLLIIKLPIFAYIDYINDDELMVQLAKSIVSGNWLGNYGYNTLLKGPVFPLYLAILCSLKLPYLLTTTLVYIIVCCVFIYSIKDIISNKFYLLLLFILMVYNPIMFSTDFQRVYRNSLTPCLAILLISFYNIILINRNNPKIFKYVFGCVMASLIFPFFYYIREDSIWIIPLMCFYSFIIFVNLIINVVKNKKIELLQVIKLFLLFLPVITLVIFESVIGNINYKYYGAKVVNMNNFESLQNAIHAISIVKDCSEDAYEYEGRKVCFTNSREKIKMLYEYSPSLNSIKDSFELAQDNLSGSEGGQISNGMFMWAFLEGVSGSGYDSFEKQNELLDNIANEINDCISNGKLETQELVPFFNDVNVKMLNFDSLYKYFKESIDTINNYKTFSVMDTYGSLYNSEYFEYRIRLFLEITNDRMLLNDEESAWKSFGELIKTNQKEYIDEMQVKLDILNQIKDLYYYVANVIEIVGYISYVALSIIVVIRTIKREDNNLLNNWFIASGLIGSIVVICLGIAYTSVTKVNVTIAFYLMSAYILNIAFCLISIFSVIKFIEKFSIFQICFKNKKKCNQ
jgi:hypothetical protein